MQSQQGGGGRGRGGGSGGRGGHSGYDGGRGGGGRGYDGGRSGRGDDVRGYDNRSDRNAGYSAGRSGPAPASARAPPVMGGQGILPPRTISADGGSGSMGEALSKEKLELRANNMRKEWLRSPDEKELMMNADELLATPGAGQTIVQVNVNYAAADSKAAELKPIIEMIVKLYMNKKVSSSDIESAMDIIVEFIDSFVCDNPQVFHYVGEMFCAFENSNILNANWLCNITSKVMEDDCKYKVIEEAMKSISATYGVPAATSCFGGKSERDAMEQLLGPTKAKQLIKLLEA